MSVAFKEWPITQLGNLISIKHGWPFRSQYFSDYQLGRPIVVNIGNFRYSGGFRFENTALKAYLGEYPKEFILKPNDILLVMTCQTAGGEILGIPGRIPNDGRTYLHNQRMGKVVILDKEKIDWSFLYWLFLTTNFNQHLVATATGAKILHTAPNRIESFQFPLPPLPTQRKIAAILSAYDDLIENNTRRIAILEEMAQSLYREWFVHFRFPGHEKKRLVESELLGLIPEGWEVVKLGDALILQRGFDLPMTQRLEGSMPVYAATGLNSTHNVAKVKGPGVLTGRSGSLGKVIYVKEDFWPLNTTLWVKDFRLVTPIYAFYLLSSIH